MINDNKSWVKYSPKKTRIQSKVGSLEEISEEVDIEEGGITLKDEITLCKKGNNELMKGMITGGTQKNKKEQPMKKNSAAGLRTPCIFNGEKVIAFVDGGALHSFIDVK